MTKQRWGNAPSSPLLGRVLRPAQCNVKPPCPGGGRGSGGLALLHPQLPPAPLTLDALMQLERALLTFIPASLSQAVYCSGHV